MPATSKTCYFTSSISSQDTYGCPLALPLGSPPAPPSSLQTETPAFSTLTPARVFHSENIIMSPISYPFLKLVHGVPLPKGESVKFLIWSTRHCTGGHLPTPPALTQPQPSSFYTHQSLPRTTYAPCPDLRAWPRCSGRCFHFPSFFP